MVSCLYIESINIVFAKIIQNLSDNGNTNSVDYDQTAPSDCS